MSTIDLKRYENASLPTLYQNYIHLAHYSRFNDELGRRETWPETVYRYIDFQVKQAKKHGLTLTSEEQYELFEAILSLEVMPSMRCLMTAGPALERDNAAGYNCLAGSTEVITQEYGVKPIRECIGQVTVLNSQHEWVPAEIKAFGKQNTVKVVFRMKNSKRTKTVRATLDHDWILTDGSRVKTSELVKGQKLNFVNHVRSKKYDSIDYKLGIIHGLIYGDGTATYKTITDENQVYAQRRLKGYVIRLCGDQKDLLPYFEGYKVSYPESSNGDPHIYVFDTFAKTHELKELPSKDETEDYLVGFFRGWIAADGYVASSGQTSLCLTIESEAWVREVMPKFGYYFQASYELPLETNYGPSKTLVRKLDILRPSLTKDDFIISRKRDRFSSYDPTYRVVEVDKSSVQYQNVYCAVVPSTHNFVLNDGLLTGNCSYVNVDRISAFDEAMYVLMCGTGMGFSVERQFIVNLPDLPEKLHPTESMIIVKDSRIGWAAALKQLISMLYSGVIPKWDTSKLRPSGAKLKTFGGRASGPGPLEDLFRHIVSVFKQAVDNNQRKLNSLQCHSIMCKIGDAVVSGGVRRSALISLSNPSDDRMRNAKSGNWWEANPHFALANNSAAWTEKPDAEIFLEEWLSLVKSKSGERGIFNREAVKKQVSRIGRRDSNYEFGVNPCSEIILRDRQFCNLTEVVVRSTDDFYDLARKVRIAATLGTLQSTLTDFRYLTKAWKDNCEEERLLGVSLTGIYDNRMMTKLPDCKTTLDDLRRQAVKTNLLWSKKLGINQSTAITCVKPSGTVSQLVDSASGIHPRHSPYYIRTVRANKIDPVAQMMVDQGIPYEDDAMKPDTGWVFSFPIKSPDGRTRNDISAIDHLRTWLVYSEDWCEHKPSVTISVKPNEWVEVASFVYDNFDKMSGVSFLPWADHVYRQAPYQEIDELEYRQWVAKMPKEIDWSRIVEYETEDKTTGTHELACTGNSCELV